MPRAICVKKDCIYYSEFEPDKCELDVIRITAEGECADQEVEYRVL
jgi:hypothetical protein